MGDVDYTKIIVMDEPTSSLSNEEVEQLFEIIENLRKKQVRMPEDLCLL